MNDIKTVKSDFDKIAGLKGRKWDHNRHYHKYLLSHTRDNMELSLDIGCGKGEFAGLLSQKSEAVIGFDLSEEMVKAADKCKKNDNIRFIVGDVMEADLGSEKYDCIASIATVHHLPFREFLTKAKAGLKKNGVFLVLDLYQAETAADYIAGAAAFLPNIIKMLLVEGRLRTSDEERAAWEEHGKHDKYMTLREIKSICDEIMPGAKVKRHFYWRYSIVWEKC